MTADFITKKPHRKSRGGCQTCKTRKIKCDEVQPKCSFCEKRRLTCSYAPRPARSNSVSPVNSQAAPSSSREASPGSDGEDISWDLITAPAPSVMTTSGGLSQEDLRMMHHWSTFTYNTLTIGEDSSTVLQFTMPQLAFENDFLLNGMLGIASLHRQRLLPDQARQISRQTDLYRARALSGFREAIARLDRHSQSYEAALIMSVLLVVLCSKDDYSSEDADENDLTIIRWVVFYRGLVSIISMKPFTQISELAVGPVFRRELTALETTPILPKILLKMFEEVTPLDPDYEQLEFYCQILDALGVLYASLRQDGLSSALFIRVVAWASFTSQQFANCATEKRPRALIILAHYLVFLKLIKGLWYLEGLPDRETPILGRIMGPKWLPYIQVPLQATQMSNREEIAELLLS